MIKKHFFMKLALVGCLFVFLACQRHEHFAINRKEELTNIVSKRVAIRTYQETGLIPFGSGGRAQDEVEMLYLAFRVPKKVSIEEARNLLLTSIKIFVDEINNEEEIRPFLSHFPFKPQNVEIRLFIDAPTKQDLALASFIRGALSYKLDVAHDQLMKTIFKESYEEAVERAFLKPGFTKDLD